MLIVWVNATIDKDVLSYKRKRFARIGCNTPNSLGTGKAAFTFSGTAPAGVGGGNGGAGANEKKNGAGVSKPGHTMF